MKFEGGKTYRTRSGGIAGPLRGTLSMMYVWAGEIEGSTVTWTADGAQQVNRRENNGLDLMPGAIEDETRKMPYSVNERLDEAYRRLHAQASTIAGMAAKIEEMQSSIDATINGVSKLYEERADRTKRTLKGGWVNVYAGDLGFASLSDWTYETKGEADFKANRDRLACIQIPDITEGEGL